MGRAWIRGTWNQPQVGLPTLRSQRQVEILGISHGSLYSIRDQLQVSTLPRLALPPAHPNGTEMEGLDWNSNLGDQGTLRAHVHSQECGPTSFPRSDPLGMKLMFVPAA